MKKHHMLVFGILIFLVMMVPLMTSSAQAFNKHGPSPIPGNLIPFPGTNNGNNHDSETPPVMPPTTK